MAETALATGTRRIVGVTGPEAVKLFQQTFNCVKKLGEDFKVKFDEVYDAVKRSQEQYQDLLNQNKQLRKQLIKSQVVEWQNQIKTVGKTPFLFLKFEDIGNQDIKTICQDLEKHKPGLYFIVNKTKYSDKFTFMAYKSKKSDCKVCLKLLSEFFKNKLNLRCGGNDEMVQGGGQDAIEQLEQELIKWLKEH